MMANVHNNPSSYIDPPSSITNFKQRSILGLTNEDLEHQRPFDEKLFEVMNNFLERLEKPICLVAHNGNKFDFPLLQSELLKINKALPEHVFCSDSLLGFREVLADEDTECNNGLPGITPLNKKCSGNPSETLPKCEWSNEDYDAELIQAVDLADKLTFGQQVFNVDELEAKINIEMERIRKSNERTPVRRTRHPIKDHSYGKVSDMRDISNRIKENSVRRKLVTDSPQPKRKYNLGALYESLTGKEFVNAHQAEGDSLALLECITAVGKPMIEWLDRNRVPFRSIKKMW